MAEIYADVYEVFRKAGVTQIAETTVMPVAPDGRVGPKKQATRHVTVTCNRDRLPAAEQEAVREAAGRIAGVGPGRVTVVRANENAATAAGRGN
jgi:hypothetical protein